MDYVIVFFLNTLNDFLIVRFYQGVIGKDRLEASIMSALIVLLSYVSIILVVDSHYNLIPAILGAFVGTFWAVKK